MFATASMVRGWLLVEQTGPWGSEAVIQSRLPPDLGLELMDRADQVGVRVLLLRRPDREQAPPEAVRECFAVHSGRPEPWIERRQLTDAAELLTFDLDGLRYGERAGLGAPWPRPLYLVCANGRHDPCCAQFGRPVARALVVDRPDNVWECSHFGGDRFAGNLICFPHGLYFGRLDPERAARVVDSYERGQIELDHYRGRAGDSFAVQAAEFFVRRESGLVGVDDLVPRARRRVDLSVTEADFDGPDGAAFRVRVGVGTAREARTLTCGALNEQSPTQYSLLSLRQE